LSGPAGGVAGAAAEARRGGLERILTFDMGGTSTDVARWAGDFAFRDQQSVGPARILARSVHVETVAAGGGSICQVRDGRLLVGPESAGAHPGPACYGAGGPLTVTDLNLLLGRVEPAAFSIPIDRAAAEAAFAREMNKLPSGESREAVLEGWLTIANLRMAQAIREVSVRDGYDPAEHALVAFGGAGGMHACAVADILGITSVVFPDNAGLLSAEGIAEAALEASVERQWLALLDDSEEALALARREMEATAAAALETDGVPLAEQELAEASLDLRLRGQEAVLAVAWSDDSAHAFRERYEEIFGYAPDSLPIEVVTLRIRLRARGAYLEGEHFACAKAGSPEPALRQAAVFGSRMLTVPVFRRAALRPGAALEGPALVVDPYSTLVIAPGWRGRLGSRGTVRMEKLDTNAGTIADARPATAVVERELLLHRFFGLVGEMGEQLQRTALSPNIRERLDFSCALLDAEGRLLVNAPHIPVHLGALGECARAVIAEMPLRPGDVVVTNHPAWGGSHLPDVTVLQGVFDPDGALLAILANRAHHAEWGGRRPGSMPAEARTLVEEGVVLTPRRLFNAGRPCWNALERALREAPFPSRAVTENLADLQAQVASLRAGATALQRLLQEKGRESVVRFLGEAGVLAASRARDTLRNLSDRAVKIEDTLDDGTPLVLQLELRGGRLRLDFTGTGATHPGNLNATPAIVRSAVLYVVRLLVDDAVPLNEGLLDPVEILLPPDSLLNPEFSEDPARCPAVVGGNIETSQRLVDLLTAALGLCANGPGTMNNVLFGTDAFGAYETIGGGSGAGPGQPGGSGMHAHMSNTAITDPEVLEFRYPVRLWQFSMRPHSGGAGAWRGGDGLVREYEWLAPMSVSVLTQRRAAGPHGMDGGDSGKPGSQARQAPGADHWESLPGILSWDAQLGERLRIESPGGGGWGAPAG